MRLCSNFYTVLIVKYPLFEVESIMQLERVIEEVALFSRVHEFLIIKFPFAQIVPSVLGSSCAFLRMLQLLISYFTPLVHNKVYSYPVALFSSNREYENEQVSEFESLSLSFMECVRKVNFSESNFEENIKTV